MKQKKGPYSTTIGEGPHRKLSLFGSLLFEAEARKRRLRAASNEEEEEVEKRRAPGTAVI